MSFHPSIGDKPYLQYNVSLLVLYYIWLLLCLAQYLTTNVRKSYKWTKKDQLPKDDVYPLTRQIKVDLWFEGLSCNLIEPSFEHSSKI